MKKLFFLDYFALFLVIIGGVNWGLLAVNQSWSLVDKLTGRDFFISRVIYGLIGLSAIYLLVTFRQFTRK